MGAPLPIHRNTKNGRGVKVGSTTCVWYLFLWVWFTAKRVDNPRVISSLWVFIPGKGWSTTCVWYLFLRVWFITERVDNPHVISSLWVLFPGGANFFWSLWLFNMGYLCFFCVEQCPFTRGTIGARRKGGCPIKPLVQQSTLCPTSSRALQSLKYLVRVNYYRPGLRTLRCQAWLCKIDARR